MKTKSGNATKDQESRLFQDEFAKRPPIFDQMEIVGGSVKLYKSIVTTPVKYKENPIQIPLSRNVNKTTIIAISRVKGSEII